MIFPPDFSSSNLLNIFITVIRLCNEKKARNVLFMVLAPHFFLIVRIIYEHLSYACTVSRPR
ncbi:hypothetical protein DVQ07_09235 [Yersinia enterocolitica]|nr:hypothetical protein [Yersinia enterocolitica]EKN5920195.1 hypothetical protein [Yersinia enterocolitica]EKN5933212.1 hypothetical protein [Yersinia enterocolitica]EKN6147228.1 hypothetical protein [Yersinia enterocolitica]EKN6333630.1 hypothetical protein [Yersinia enterocolitica]